MLSALRQARRVVHIGVVLGRYGFDEVLSETPFSKPARMIRFLAPISRRTVGHLSRGARLRLILQELGPIFVKFGQVLSTRRDLVPEDIADELAMLQDRVEPFPGELARAAVERRLGRPVGELFTEFDVTPLASASIAQVHAARLADGREVVVKVLRPGIRSRIADDIALIRTVAALAQRYVPHGRQLRPSEIVAEFEKTIFDELDLQREAANASQLRRNFENSLELYVPEIYWPYTKEDVMVMERVRGIPIDNLTALHAAGVDIKLLAERGIRIFYTQVFRDNFFHADMHPGNILVDATDPADPTYIALDFGIVGTLPPAHFYYLGENFIAFFNQDYRRVAELHIEAGWISDQVRVDELEQAVRTVCEPQFARNLSEISFAEVLFQLFRVARRFNLIVQPELVLLQKTLLNIEGLGRQLDPELDIWGTTRPILTKIMRERHGIEGAARDLRDRLPGWLERTPQVPGLVFDVLRQVAAGELRVQARVPDMAAREQLNEKRYRRTIHAIFAVGLGISGSVMLASGSPGPMWESWSIPGLVLLLASAFTGMRAWPR